MEPRPHRGIARRPRPAGAAFPSHPCRRDEREGVDVRLRRQRAPCARVARWALYLAAPGIAHRADHGGRRAEPIIMVDTSLRARRSTTLGLRGRHQVANALVAHAVLNALPEPFGPVGKNFPASFANAYIPGRFEVRGKWIFDVAHNPDGMQVVSEAVRSADPPILRPLHALVGIRNDKDWRAMLEMLRPVVDRLALTVPPSIPVVQRWSIEDMGPDVSFEH